MNVEEAIQNIESTQLQTTLEARVLMAEVKRLREQRRLLYHAIPDGVGVPLAIWQEIHEEEQKEEKEMTVLATEVKRLREEKEQLHINLTSNRSQIQLLTKEVQQLHELNVALRAASPAYRKIKKLEDSLCKIIEIAECNI